YGGRSYGTKAESFEAFFELPSLTSRRLEIAMGGTDAPRDFLLDKGWHLQNPLEVARLPQDFMTYVRESRGELAVAKQGYVESNSGWFSERSAGYLASGRPVVTQETGFSEWLPTGAGLFAFRDTYEAVQALDDIENDYERHAKAARRIAEDYFDSKTVLARLLAEITR
ncbi:MAG: glycosyltransferase, partial [Thermoanaerobaculia bacterium]